MGHAEAVALTKPEGARFAALERLVSDGLRTFREVGGALLAIRDERLYRATHGTFEIYCRERWGMSRRQADRITAASEVANRLRPRGLIQPTSEKQVRPLASLPEEQQQQAWQAAVEKSGGAQPTAAIVEQAAAEVSGRLAPLMSSKTPEHYTPQNILKAVVACLGTIELDPCSNDGEPNVKADRHYTASDDGLSQSWIAKTVFMNPPYGREIESWVEKLCSEHESGNTEQAIALVPARTDTRWFRMLRDFICCFVKGRLTFIGNEDAAPFPSAIFYLGENIVTFHDSFIRIGDIWQRVEREMLAE